MLAEAPYDLTEAAFRKDNDADKKLLVVFNEEAVKDNQASIEQGRLVCKSALYIMIMVPGDKDSIVHRPATERDKERFADRYHAYLNKQKQEVASGTPLGACSFLTKAQVKELEYFNCYTVEQLADIPDTHARNFLDLQRLKQLAKSFLESASGMAPISKLQDENTKLKEQLEQTQEALNDLGSRFKALESALVDDKISKKK